MNFQSEYCTNALQELERLTASLKAGKISPAASSFTIRCVDNILSELTRQVPVNDRLNICIGSEEELVFRTARLVIDTQLGRLDDVIRSILGGDEPGSSTPGVWQSFLSALLLAKAELWRITRIWLTYRRGEPTIRDPSHAAAYKLALRAAFNELHKMDEIPEIERLLYRGVASARWLEIARACEQTLVAIHVQVEMEPVRRLWAARTQWARALGHP